MTTLTTPREIFVVRVSDPKRPAYADHIETKVFDTHLVARAWGQQQVDRHNGQVLVTIARGIESR